MPSQHGATNWVQKETRRLAHRSVELVKNAMPAKVEASGAPALVDNSPIVNERMIPEILEKGIMMTKISDDKQKKVFFQIDPDEGAIKYKSSSDGITRRTSASFVLYTSKADFCTVPIESIKEIRTDSDTEYYRLQFQQPDHLESKWITMIYVLQGTYKTLHIIADTHDICQLWKDALQKLLAIRQGLMSGQLNFAERQNIWERQYFKGADKEGDQVLDFDDIKRLCLRLNINLTNEKLEILFKVTCSISIPRAASIRCHFLGS